MYSILTNSNQTWTTSVRVLNLYLKSKFHDPTDSEHKFHKTRIENWLCIGLDSPDREPTVVTTTTCSTDSQTVPMMGSLKLLYTNLQSLGTILETFHFP